MSPALYAMVFVTLGIVLVGVEVTLIPGFGFVGVLGAAAMMYGAWIVWTAHGLFWGAAVMAAGTLISVVGVVLLVRSGWSKKLVLQTTTEGPASDLRDEGSTLVGLRGVAASDLRPSGVARIAERRRDVVVRDGGYVMRDAPVEVVSVSGNTIFVVAVAAPVSDPTPAPSPEEST